MTDKQEFRRITEMTPLEEELLVAVREFREAAERTAHSGVERLYGTQMRAIAEMVKGWAEEMRSRFPAATCN